MRCPTCEESIQTPSRYFAYLMDVQVFVATMFLMESIFPTPAMAAESARAAAAGLSTSPGPWWLAPLVFTAVIVGLSFIIWGSFDRYQRYVERRPRVLARLGVLA